MKNYQSFLREVVLPQSHRITFLLLEFIAANAFEGFLLLPPGLFDELECTMLCIPETSTYEYPGPSVDQATVFQGAPRLQRVTVPLSNEQSLLDLALPWNQLTYS